MTIKVVVIDDSSAIRETAQALLKEAGFEVITAGDGFEAMSTINDNHPDIVFVDIESPRLDGYQTCTLIKNNRRFKDIPVILMSGSDDAFDSEKGRIAGSEHHINKPLTEVDLISAIDRLVRQEVSH